MAGETGGAGAAAPNTPQTAGGGWQGVRKPTPAELREYAKQAGFSEDYARFDDGVLNNWIDNYWDIGANKFKSSRGEPGFWEKPTETRPGYVPSGPNETDPAVPQGQMGGGGGGMGGGGGGMGGGGSFYAGAPSYQQALQDPGYQFAVGEGQRALEGSAAAQGTLRTSGTLKDLIDYGQQAGAQQYQNVWNRWYAPWQTQYQGNLQKYLQKENNIYGLMNSPPPWAYGAY